MMKKIELTLDKSRKVVKIKNNEPYKDQYNKIPVKVGDRLPNTVISLFIMNPHRFDITWK